MHSIFEWTPYSNHFVFITIILSVFVNVFPEVICHAMYLMMGHNAKEHAGFLTTIKRLTLHWFCGKHVVNNQLCELNMDEKQLSVVMGNEREEQILKKQDLFETNISAVYKSRKNGMELSIETTVH